MLDVLASTYGRAAFQGMVKTAASRGHARLEARERLREETRGNEVRTDALVGGTEVVRNSRGSLTPPARGRAATQIALDFLKGHAAAYGLTPRQVDQFDRRGESLSRDSGMRMVRLHQRILGLPVFQADTRIVLDREGRVIRTVGRIVPDVDESRVPTATGHISAAEALSAALGSVGVNLEASRMRLGTSSREGWTTDVVAGDARVVKSVPSRLTYFPLGPGIVVPAWEQVIRLEGFQGWYTVVDAWTGTILYRKSTVLSLSKRPARFAVYARPDGSPLESPAPGSPNHLLPGSGTQFPTVPRTILSMQDVQDPVASPDGWIPDSGDTTKGNNAEVFLDPVGSLVPSPGVLDERGRARGNLDAQGRNRDFLGASPRSFESAPPPQGGNPDAGDVATTAPYQRGSVTNLFYLVNYWHDRMYQLGFDEVAGNYQQQNFHRGGKAGDPVLAAAQAGYQTFISEGGGVFFVAPDGESGEMPMVLWGSPDPDRDAALDAQVPLHELTHGMTSRIIGDASGLNWSPGASMGEGWSDFFAIALIHSSPGEDPDAQYPMAPYVAYRFSRRSFPVPNFTDNYLYGIRAFPVSTDNGVNPLTWADADDFTGDYSGGIPPSPQNWQRNRFVEGHNVGLIWATTLWEVRSRIIAAHGGDVPLGNDVMLQIVVDSLKLLPPDPGFIEARDAMIDADCAANTCANETAIWSGFADRGLGYKAHTSIPLSANYGVRESFDAPYLDALVPIVDDSLGNGNGFVEPGETVSLRIPLLNPWRSSARGVASAHAVLSSSTPGVSIGDASADYGPIPAGEQALGDSATFTLDAGAACGSSLEFSLDTTSSLGPATTRFTLRVGRPAGNGAPVIFSRILPGGLEIPDGQSSATDELTVAEDLQIADLDFQIDSLQHPWVGDLEVILRGPSGLGLNLVYFPAICFPKCTGQDAECLRGACLDGANDGDNFVNTRIDDSSSNDLFAAGPSAAPFTGDWVPFFNSPSLQTPPSVGDPVGQLSHFIGTSTKGTWRLRVIDIRTGNVGTLNGWSLIVKPVAYQCGP